MKITVNSKFLVLPVSPFVSNTNVRIFKDGVLVDDISLRLDYKNSCTYSYFPIEKYMGCELTVTAEPYSELRDIQTDIIKRDEKTEIFRPFVHFTAEYGWINDPNGLVKYTSPVDGKTTYHMFYQHNPYDWEWGNMHWGHAVSDDLLTWKHLPDALYPDDGGTMFSGSAVVDKTNCSGLRVGKEDPILLFYTCAGRTSARSREKDFVQCMAYSTDGGITFTKYENNPVVDTICPDNRDPKVVWCEELCKYVMALYLEGNRYTLLTSENLLDWVKIQEYELEGDGECPDIYPLNADGDPNKRKWIISGASYHYIVGDFVDGRFVECQSMRCNNSGPHSYAAQTFFDDNEDERIQIAWIRNTNFGSAYIKGQMSVPCRLWLEDSSDGFNLCSLPIDDFSFLYGRSEKFENISVAENSPFIANLEETAYEICIEMNPTEINAELLVQIFGSYIIIDKNARSVYADNCRMPLSFDNQTVKLKMIFDKGTIEFFDGYGKSTMSVPYLSNYNRNYASISSAEKCNIEKITLTELTCR